MIGVKMKSLWMRYKPMHPIKRCHDGSRVFFENLTAKLSLYKPP